MREKSIIPLDAVIIPRSFFRDNTFNRGKVNDLFAFIDLIQMAKQVPEVVNIKGIPVKLERGDIATSVRILAGRWGWSVNATSNALLRYEKQHRVIRRKSNLTSIISIVNYDQFVCNPNADEYTNEYADRYAEGNTSHAHEKDNISKFNNKINKSTRQIEELNLFEGESKEKSKKEEKTLLSHAPHDDVSVSFSDAADRIYNLYPASVVKSDGTRRSLRCGNDKQRIVRLLKRGHTEEELSKTIKTYLAEQPGEYTRMLSTFLNNLPDYSEAEQPVQMEKPSWVKDGEFYSPEFIKRYPSVYDKLPDELQDHIQKGKCLRWNNNKWNKA